MSQVTINIYTSIGTQWATGMGNVALGVPPPPATTIQDLINQVYADVQPLYLPGTTTLTDIELKSVISNSINGYVNSELYTGNALTETLLRGILQIPVASLLDFIGDVEDNITKSGLSLEQQKPLFIATAIGKAAVTYWFQEVNNNVAPWANFFNDITNPAPGNPAYNRMNIQTWVACAMEGALLGYQSGRSLLDESPNTTISSAQVGLDIISALAGAITVGAGKVMFRWIPRLYKS
ncbi:MAG: hypothetical protein NTX03_12000 [Bacteroidetes bacterium]|nr:hypothetical protein [Bacteroidota bacterium]